MFKAIAALAVTMLVIVGVLWNDSNHSVAMIDLDKVANEIGRTELISDKVQSFVTVEEGKLNEFRKELNKVIEDLKKEQGNKPSKKQTQQLTLTIRRADAEMQQRISIVQKKAADLKVSLVLNFRNELIPTIKAVAKDGKFDVVEILSPRQIYINPEVDISDEVVSRILSSPKRKAEPSKSKSTAEQSKASAVDK